ncbi:MAG: pentapeptide repeat-containing protein, partial [Myxococcota bacterium]
MVAPGAELFVHRTKSAASGSGEGAQLNSTEAPETRGSWNSIQDLGGTAPGNLQGAMLVGRNLSGIDLSGVDLRNANLANANLTDAVLVDAKLDRAILHGANLTRCEFHRASLVEARLEEVEGTQAGFGQANLKRASLFGAALRHASFVQADLSQTDLRTADLTETNFDGANLSDASLCRSILHRANLTRSQITGASFREADLRDAQVRGLTGFRSATFIEADIRNVHFGGAYLLRRHIMDEDYIHELAQRGGLYKLTWWMWCITSDFGRSLLRWSLLIALITMVYGGLYSAVDMEYGEHETFLSPYYFSLVTLTSLGYGDVLPASTTAQVLAMSECVV